MARPFIGDRRASVLVLFALILPVILTGVLGLLSVSGMTAARADLQAASNAAANAILADLNSALQVSATPDAIVPDVDKQARANAIVQSLLGARSDLTNITTQVDTGPTAISVTVSAQTRNVTGDLFALPFFSQSATTSISWMRADQLQIALAIDSGTTVNKTANVSIRMAILKPLMTLAVDALSIMPNYPDIALALVPFTAQIATDPTTVVADAVDDSKNLIGRLQNQFAAISRDVSGWFLPSANAAVTTCFGDPIIPAGVDGWSFGGVNKPVQKACASSVVPLRKLRKISRPVVKGVPVFNEGVNSAVKLARDDLISAINAISPAGCRNLAMGVTWSLAQLPNDNNPKIIFLIANGNNSQSSKGKTSECAVSGSVPAASQTQLDSDFVAACGIVRDPVQNKGRRLDLIVLQIVDGNSIALKSCASTTDGSLNYASASTSTLLKSAFDLAQARIFTAAQAQVKSKSKGNNEDKQKGEEKSEK